MVSTSFFPKSILFVPITLSILIQPQKVPDFLPPLPLPLPDTDPYPEAPFLQPINFFSNESSFSDLNTSEIHPLNRRDVIGTDDRVFWTSTVFPYSAMGRLETLTLSSNGRPTSRALCSATLIGPRHIATAAHCVQTASRTLSKVRFQPSFDSCESADGGSFASYILATAFQLNSGDCSSYNDVAVLVLDDRLGDKLGFLKTGLVDLGQEVGRPVWNSFGYPADKGNGERPVRQQGISIVRAPGGCGKGNPIVTNADVGLGMSGGPLWYSNSRGEVVMVGVLSTSVGFSNGGKISAFSGGEWLVEYVAKVRREYP